MLKELKISNFRLFDDEVTVRFRPITVLIGRNNSGKSSIIKFLLMLQQSLGPSAQFLNPEGNRVKLGSFPALKNSLTKKRKLKFELTVEGDTSPRDALWRHIEDKVEVPSRLSYAVKAEVSYSQKGQKDQTETMLSSVKEGKKSMIDAWRQNISPNSSFLDFSREILLLTEDPKAHLAEEVCKLTLRDQIGALRHLLPVRGESQRVIVASPSPQTDIGQKGQFALPRLQRLIYEEKKSYRFMRRHVELIAGISDIKFLENQKGYIVECIGTNKQTGADVHISDFGFGVSQCIPIFVQGAVMSEHTSLMVEQPEAQLHPDAQLEMGSFFADLWNERKVGSIIETHSDNILLRLRRLIAKGTLDSQAVSVAYFALKDRMPIVKNLDIYDDGSMQKGLPMEFFGKDVIEGLKLGAKQ